MEKIVSPILLRYGGALKSSFDMSSLELDQAATSILKRAKEKAFYKGLPVYYVANGALIAEYPDGRKETIKSLRNASRTIRHSRAQRNW